MGYQLKRFARRSLPRECLILIRKQLAEHQRYGPSVPRVPTKLARLVLSGLLVSAAAVGTDPG